MTAITKTFLPKVKLQLVRENRRNYQPERIIGPSVVEKMLGWMRLEAEEIFVALHLNAKNEVIAYHEVSRGTVSMSLVHPREVFKAAILNNAHSIIVAHNHPTGDNTPSREDIEVTEQLIKAGSLLGVPVTDHLIFGDGEAYSFQESKHTLWSWNS